MSPIKTLSLAAFAVLAAMAFVASPASADTLCEVEASPCPEELRVLVGRRFSGLTTAVNAKFLNQSKGVLLACHSETLGEITETGGGKPVVGKITKFLLTACEGPCSKAHGFNLNYKFEAIAAAGHVLLSKGTGAGKPGVTVEGCTAGVKCNYEITNPSALFKVSKDTWTATDILFSLLNPGFCSLLATGQFWDATYLITLDGSGTPLSLSA